MTIVRGYFAVWSDRAQVDGHLERIAPGAFQNHVTRVVCSHDQRPGAVIAFGVRVLQDDFGAKFQLDLDDARRDVRQLIAAVRAGGLANCSFEFSPLATRWDEDEQTRVVQQARLHEISITGPVAAYGMTGVWVHGDKLRPRLALLAAHFERHGSDLSASAQSPDWDTRWGLMSPDLDPEHRCARARAAGYFRPRPSGVGSMASPDLRPSGMPNVDRMLAELG